MKKHFIYIIFLLSSFLLFSKIASADVSERSLSHKPVSHQNSVVLSDHQLGLKLFFLEDVDDRFSLEYVRSLAETDWHKSDVATPNFGYTNSSYWFRTSLKSSDKGLDTLLAIQYSLLDHIEVYVLENGRIEESYLSGDIYPFAQRPIKHRDFLFPISFQANQTLDLYIKIKTKGSFQVPIGIWEREQFLLQDQHGQFLKAIYYGMLLVLIVCNLFLFVSIRERSYLYYSGLVISFLVLMAGVHGFLYQYLYPSYPQLHKFSILLAVPSAMLFIGLFAGRFLSLARIAPRLNTVVCFFNAAFLISIIATFFIPYDISTRTSVFLAIPSSLIIMFCGVYAWTKGQSSARYFTYAWVFLITGVVVNALCKFGILPSNFFTDNSLNWGSAIEALLLSFALADRFNTERQDKIKAQKAQLKEERQRITAEEKLYSQATHQSLDGLPNTLLFQQVIYRVLYADVESKPNFSLFYLHLKGMQDISKTLGHANADIILGLFSKRLLRLDSFIEKAVLIEETKQHKFYFAHIEKGLFAHAVSDIELNCATEYARELMMYLAEPIEYKGMKLDLGVSIGIACFPEHGRDIDILTRHARVAIDVADNSNGQIGVYSPDINPYSERRLMLMGELKKAIDNDTLVLHYQPIISCDSYEVVSVEALLRWNHESLGYVPPDEFITIAEQTGIMRYLTRWVLKRAFRDHANRRRHFGSSTLSVNISVVNLHEPDLEEYILELLNTYDFPAEELVLEITETSVMKDPEYAISALNSLAEKGVKLAIDDFGTGYSSLSYIQKLPIYEIKIDRCFIQNMNEKAGDKAIVKTILNLSKDLGYRVVAEGIENKATLDKLKHMKCDYGQGFHIARPMSINDLIKWQSDIKSDEPFTELKSS